MDFSPQIKSSIADIIKLIQGAVQINSVEDISLPGKPFGNGSAVALQYFLDASDCMGFTSENFDNYAGHIDLDIGASETVGILCHVDVVPAGDGWICNPYSGEIINERIYGRGTIDNKGPAVVCLYAMKILKDMKLPLKRNIRMILGTNEETGWGCMNYYFSVLNMPQPDFGFAPDSYFPVTYAEKGVLRYLLKKTFSSAISIKGGSTFNSVPDFASITIDAKYFHSLKNSIASLSSETGCAFNLKKQDEGLLVEVAGIAAHAAYLEDGKNAISALMLALSTLELEGDIKVLSDFYNQYIGMCIHGEKLGIFSKDDESGMLSCNIGKIYFEENALYICIDNRVPVTLDPNDTMSKLESRLHDSGFEIEYLEIKEPSYVSRDSFLVQTLLDAYRRVTGDFEAMPTTSGGGTYARVMNDCVAFGSLLKDQPDLMHSKDEYIEISKIDEWLAIYLEAIYRLAT